MRWWPRSLAGQLIAGLLVVMSVAYLISIFAFIDERRLAIHEAGRFQSLSRIASVVRLVESVPIGIRDGVVREAGGPMLRFTLSRESAVNDQQNGFRAKMIRHRLVRRLGDEDRVIRIGALEDRDGFWRSGMWRHFRRHRADMVGDDKDDDRRYWRGGGHHMRGPVSGGGMVIAVRLVDGNWLNIRTLLPPMAPGWAMASLTAMVATALALMLLIVLLVRRATRPLTRLAAAAERAGRGETFSPLPEEGPSDVRETIAAFNRMQDRQQRFIADRTRLLAAISHDLRTPITSLRIRAEFIEDIELRAKIMATLDDMQAMAEATLTFVREDATEEDFLETDLGALAGSVCADASDMGKAVHYVPVEGARVIGKCRPHALRRALSNIVDNALAYAGSAEIHIDQLPAGIALVVEDDGPGIAENDLQRVFEPFVRLEESRNRDSGGMGLGMAIARTILRAHGGDVNVVNRAQGGLRVTLQLPPQAGV
ncbi:MAG: HAMP domain-containing protein [Rhodospirillales bacterium]|nr:HAMP domain-containing protein [Rhodospirillales bacterium]